MRDNLKELKELLEGSYVLEVKESDRDESLCEFVVAGEDNKIFSFILYATDLGNWVADIKDHKGNFENVQDIIEEAFDHRKHNGVFECCDDPVNKTFGFKCTCGKVLKVSESTANCSSYAEFFHDPGMRKKIALFLSESYIMNSEFLKTIINDYEPLCDEIGV